MDFPSIEKEALGLQTAERARLAAALLQSLDELSGKETARLWAEEAERRDTTWDPQEAIPYKTALREARSRIS
ncbi:MAG: addiction module protein [Pyrinomonadaceae bacterium]